MTCQEIDNAIAAKNAELTTTNAELTVANAALTVATAALAAAQSAYSNAVNDKQQLETKKSMLQENIYYLNLLRQYQNC